MSNPTIDEILDSEWYREPSNNYYDEDSDLLYSLEEFNDLSDDFDDFDE
jgi:hypothetical protein